MFGYVTACKPELKMKDYYKYKAYYCGLCHVLRERHGMLGQMTLTYDMTFLVILLTSLYECDTTLEESRCMVHPVKKQKMLFNEITEYAADMNIVLTYFHFADDWTDERSKAGLTGMHAFHRTYEKIAKKYPEKCTMIRRCLYRLRTCEKRGEENIDITARYFGELMAELFSYREDVWKKPLRRMGFYLGKFIYMLDAYDDIEKDMESGNYNALKSIYGEEDFDDRCMKMITYVMAECASQFERLPCVQDVDILRNIIYVGVWEKFDKKLKEKDNNYDNKSI